MYEPADILWYMQSPDDETWDRSHNLRCFSAELCSIASLSRCKVCGEGGDSLCSRCINLPVTASTAARSADLGDGAAGREPNHFQGPKAKAKAKKNEKKKQKDTKEWAGLVSRYDCVGTYLGST